MMTLAVIIGITAITAKHYKYLPLIFTQLPPMTMLEKNADGSVTVHGITGKFFDTMKSIMNFT